MKKSRGPPFRVQFFLFRVVRVKGADTDPARNMARFYTMALQPTLFGEWALLKEWGRIGSAGRLVSCRFASEQEAALAMAEHLKAKLSKGYEAV